MKRRITMLVGSAALILALAAGVAVALNAIDCPNRDGNRCIGTDGQDELDGRGETANLLIDALQGADTAQGGDGNDTMLGRRGADGELPDSDLEFDGGDGNDTIYGHDGDDHELDGDSGDDRLEGGPGNEGDRNSDGSCEFSDSIRGEDGKNTVIGNSGRDCIDAATEAAEGGDVEIVYGGQDNDVIAAQDGVKDTVDCGDGRADVAFFDEGLDSVKNCEVKNPTAGGASISSTGTGDTGPADDDQEEAPVEAA